MKRKLLNTIGLATALSMVGLAIASDAMALPDTGHRIIYFSDDGPSPTIVGRDNLYCNGNHTFTGEETPYFHEEDWDCGTRDDPPSGDPCQIAYFCS